MSLSVVFGNSSGLAVVDFLQKTLLLNMGISELCSPADPHLRQPRSPRKTRHTSTGERKYIYIHICYIYQICRWEEPQNNIFISIMLCLCVAKSFWTLLSILLTDIFNISWLVLVSLFRVFYFQLYFCLLISVSPACCWICILYFHYKSFKKALNVLKIMNYN